MSPICFYVIEAQSTDCLVFVVRQILYRLQLVLFPVRSGLPRTLGFRQPVLHKRGDQTNPFRF